MAIEKNPCQLIMDRVEAGVRIVNVGRLTDEDTLRVVLLTESLPRRIQQGVRRTMNNWFPVDDAVG